MERIDLTFYNNRFSIYRYIFSHMWNFCSKKPEYHNSYKKMIYYGYLKNAMKLQDWQKIFVIINQFHMNVIIIILNVLVICYN